jgi:hypothetical protein
MVVDTNDQHWYKNIVQQQRHTQSGVPSEEFQKKKREEMTKSSTQKKLLVIYHIALQILYVMWQLNYVQSSHFKIFLYNKYIAQKTEK